MPTEMVGAYLERAEDLLRGMNLTKDDDPYQNSSALLAIHSAISYADALRVGLGETGLAAGDHQTASEGLRKLLAAKRCDDMTGISHLQQLLSRKTAVAYGSRRLDAASKQLLTTKAARFAAWANRTGAELKIDGWRYDGE
jgi:hypothetical protein